MRAQAQPWDSIRVVFQSMGSLHGKGGTPYGMAILGQTPFLGGRWILWAYTLLTPNQFCAPHFPRELTSLTWVSELTSLTSLNQVPRLGTIGYQELQTRAKDQENHLLMNRN